MNVKYKSLIVEDEKLAREDLKDVISNIPEINLVAETDNVSDAREILNQKEVDLIFLDIQLKGEKGFDLLEFVKPRTKVIFVTAFDEYAIKAFEVNALDYLLKPVNPERLKQSLERIETKNEEPKRLLDYDDSLFIMLNNRYNFIKINSIMVINAAGDYTEITNIDKKKLLTNKLMKEWEEKLPNKYFKRIHRSTIINMDFVDHIEDWFNQSYSVHIKGLEKPFVMSRAYAAKFKKEF